MDQRLIVPEPIIENDQKKCLYPIEYIKAWDFYQKHMSTFWVAKEIDFSQDINDWNNKLNDNERYYIEMVLGFFASSDFIVNEHLSHNFIDLIKPNEIQMYYRYQEMMEDIHSTTYADMINTYVQDETKKEQLFNAVTTIPTIAKKAEWAKKHIYPEENIHPVKQWVRRLVAFSAVEGIFFSGAFCAIFWMKKRGLMPGLTFSNELISRDEGLHTDFACYLYRDVIMNKLSKKEVLSIITEAVLIEHEFVQSSLPVELIGMNSKLMCTYVEFVADRLLMSLIGEKYFYSENPFEWMGLISLETKPNFFEHRVSNYSKNQNSEMNFDSAF